MSNKTFLPGSIEYGIVKVLTVKGYAMSRAELAAELQALGLKRGRGAWPQGALWRLARAGLVQVTKDGTVTMFGLVEGDES